jgi:chromosomal replication initiator protein
MLWQKTKDALKEKLPESIHTLWIEPLTGVDADRQTLELICPDPFFRAWLKENYLPVIQETAVEIGARPLTVRLSVAKGEGSRRSGSAGDGDAPAQQRLPAIPEARSFVRSLHPRYTFDEFMVGESNQLAQSACQALASGDMSLGTSLYINGGTGLGKSHLTHAVAHSILRESPTTRLHYLTAQQFTSEMVRQIQSRTMDSFKEKYHYYCDILLLEDVHTLSGKVKTQIELNEILDALMKSGKRVILTSAYGPRDIAGIDEGFRSRMSAGLISTIVPPDRKTRCRIIRRKAQNCHLPLEEELVDFLARRIRGDVRQLESAVVGLKAKSTLLSLPPDLEMIKEVVASIVGASGRELTVEAIMNVVAGEFKISVNDLSSRSRKKTITFPRQISMYLARRLTEQGLSDIGRAFNRDHSTVLHSIRVMNESMARNPTIRGQVEILAKKLKK